VVVVSMLLLLLLVEAKSVDGAMCDLWKSFDVDGFNRYSI
jgi:hypothetical protein